MCAPCHTVFSGYRLYVPFGRSPPRPGSGEVAEPWRRGAVSIANAADSGVAAESHRPIADTHRYDLQPQPATRGHSATAASEMPAAAGAPEPDSAKRLTRNPQNRAATPSRSEIIPGRWFCALARLLHRIPRMPEPHLCTRPATQLLTPALQTAHRSPRRAPRAREALIGIRR